MKPKHLPPVVDAAIRDMPREHIADYKEIAAVLPRAQRFFLNEEASARLGNILVGTEDVILENHQFALPPFETCYIELNCRVLYESAGKRNGEFKNEPGDDDWVGYLIDRGRIWIFCRANNGKNGMGPWRIEDSLGHASFWPDNFMDEARGLGPEWGRLAVLLGSSIHKIPSEAVRQELLQRFTIHPVFRHADGSIPRIYHEDWATYECAMGDLRNVLAVLLILNSPQHIMAVPQQPRHFIYKGRRVTYAAHKAIHITLGETVSSRRLFHHYSGIHHRRHLVKGHFVHIHVARDCAHDWPTIPENEVEGSPRWQCTKCQGLRVWRKQHERGDAALGYVTHEYRVK